MTVSKKPLTDEANPLILIVDDIPKNLQVLSNILNAEGYRISFASNGAHALKVLENSSPDLILLDIMMPEMDGYETCEKIKANDRLKDIPIIFLTGKAEIDDIVRGLKLGAVDYITKPFNSAELLTRVRSHVELKLSKDKLVEYANELEIAEKELKALNASKDKFFSIISHDLRGPFSGFLGLSQLLAEEYDELQKEDITQIAQSMNKAAKRLFSFLENLLEWSRSQMGRIEYIPISVDLNDAATRVLSLFTNTAEEKQIETLNEIPAQLYAKADNQLLNTVLRNFVSNAIKFTDAGGKVTLSASEKDENFIEVSVSDTGVGIDEEGLSKIFRIDTKYSTQGTKNEQGTGLGLLLCKELIEKQGGQIEVESELGAGTKFKFTLPKPDNI